MLQASKAHNFTQAKVSSGRDYPKNLGKLSVWEMSPSHSKPLCGWPTGPFSRKISLWTTDTVSYKTLGRELDEVGKVSRMPDLMGPSGPGAYEAVNLQLYCHTVMLRQNWRGKEMKLK